MDLIREILLAAEEGHLLKQHFTEKHKAEDQEQAKYSVNNMAFHVELLNDAGFVEGMTARSVDGNYVTYGVARLKWSGCEFLDAIRSETIWTKTKDAVIKPALGFTLPIIMKYAQARITEALGMGKE